MTRNEQQLHGNSHIFSPFVFVLFLKENFYSVCEQKLGSIRHLMRREDTPIVTSVACKQKVGNNLISLVCEACAEEAISVFTCVLAVWIEVDF